MQSVKEPALNRLSPKIPRTGDLTMNKPYSDSTRDFPYEPARSRQLNQRNFFGLTRNP